MHIELDMPTGLAEQLKQVVLDATKAAIEEQQKKAATKEWLDLKSGAAYAGVSYNTFMRFHGMGLKIVKIEGVRRVSKKEIDKFFESNSF